MEYFLSKRSNTILRGACNELKKTTIKAISYGIIDFSVIESIREKQKQNRLFKLDKSRVQWPNGKHNIKKKGDLSDALDIVPFVNGKISWKKDHCILMAGVILAAGAELGYDIRWGGNWDMDGEPITDQDFQDLVHFEIRRKDR